MDHLSHPLPHPGQTTHYQPLLHRRPRPSTLRLQRRLSRRILRRCLSHHPSSNLRGYLCPPASNRFRIDRPETPSPKRSSRDTCPTHRFQTGPRHHDSCRDSRPRLSTRAKLGSPRPAPSRMTLCLHCQHNRGRAALPWPRQHVRDRWASAPASTLARFVILSEEFALRSEANPQSKDPFQLNPSRSLRKESSSIILRRWVSCNNPRRRPNGRRAALPGPRQNTKRSRASAPTDFCEHTMNSPCGNRIHNPGIKPVIVEDTTCGVSLLTGTICGSNFAFP